MWKALRSGILIGTTLLAMLSCSTAFTSYSSALFEGKDLYRDGAFDKARTRFEEALKYNRDPAGLAYLAAIHYRAGDVAMAEKLILEAETTGSKSLAGLRIAGYKALILLRKNKAEGMKSLGDYVDMYRFHYPLDTIGEVEKMLKTGQVDELLLGKLIEEQVGWYENDMEQFLSTHTGFFDGIYGHPHD